MGGSFDDGSVFFWARVNILGVQQLVTSTEGARCWNGKVGAIEGGEEPWELVLGTMQQLCYCEYAGIGIILILRFALAWQFHSVPASQAPNHDMELKPRPAHLSGCLLTHPLRPRRT
jgi:hypothetical protein